ncbi:thioredoxin family protein [Gaoshiqia sediminis]|uniref:Thioredoxin family protein n=1 Tax=Gaoshiqia sediminis TaxID=2986998 RepID=A0AA41Y7J9_9BACT|nr:thioredoxin family protein [Gaoshiqia sediminis]MCW0484896.1 thioredoxin family protein [Gaoshiqia sediminis]
MLHTNLRHVLSADEHEKLIAENENVMVCCGRMGPMCIPVYAAMSELENEYEQVVFADMEFDIPAAAVIRNAPECRGFMGLPFVVYYKNGELVHATSSIQSKEQIAAILEKKLVKGEEVGKIPG